MERCGRVRSLICSCLQWQWRPEALLSGGWGYRVDLDRPENAVDVALDWRQNLTVERLRLRGRLSDWVSQFQGASVPLDVEVELSADSIELSRQGCVNIEQTQVALSQWRGLMADMLNQLGPVSVALSCVDGAIIAELSAKASQLSGRWRLDPNLNYQLELQVAAGTASLHDRLTVVGFRKQAGVMQYRQQGRLELL